MVREVNWFNLMRKIFCSSFCIYIGLLFLLHPKNNLQSDKVLAPRSTLHEESQVNFRAMRTESLALWYGQSAIRRYRESPTSDPIEILQDLTRQIIQAVQRGAIPEEVFRDVFFTFPPRLGRPVVLIPQFPLAFDHYLPELFFGRYPEPPEEWLKRHTSNDPRFLLPFIVNKKVIPKQLLLIGIAGPTGSGKTMQAKQLAENMQEKGLRVKIISTDDYLIPRAERKEKGLVGGLETHDMELLRRHAHLLRQGTPFQPSEYDHATGQTRKGPWVDPSQFDAIIFEGQFALTLPELRDLFHIKIYVDTPDFLRFFRRVGRDLKERGHSIDDVTWIFVTSQVTEYLPHVRQQLKYADACLMPEEEKIWFRDGFARETVYSLHHQFHGGTPARTHLAFELVRGRWCVIKSAHWEGVGGNGIPWVLSQARYMRLVRKELGSGIVPEVYEINEAEDGVSYTMEYLKGATTESERLLTNRNTRVQDIHGALNELIHFLATRLYKQRPITRTPTEIQKAHLKRIQHRLGLVTEPPPEIYRYLMKNRKIDIGEAHYPDISALFRDLLTQDVIVINGHAYPNLPRLIAVLNEHRDLLEKRLGISHVPVFCHGDLSWRNAMRMPDGSYRLIDTRGTDNIHQATPSTISIEYEMGKLVHSLLSDFLERNLFSVKMVRTDHGWHISAALDTSTRGAQSFLSTYDDIDRFLSTQQDLGEMLGENIPSSIKQIRLAEAAHYIANIINRINEDPTGQHALMYYVYSVLSLAHFLHQENLLPSAAISSESASISTAQLLATPMPTDQRRAAAEAENKIDDAISEVRRHEAPFWMARNYFPGSHMLVRDFPPIGPDSKNGKIEQALDHLNLAAQDPAMKSRVGALLEAFRNHPDADGLSILEFEGIAHRLIKRETGIPNAYQEYKEDLDRLYGAIYPLLKRELLSISDFEKRLKRVMMYATFGNFMDLSHPEVWRKAAQDLGVPVEAVAAPSPETLLQLLHKTCEKIQSEGLLFGEEEKQFEHFLDRMKKMPGKLILYFVDNHGEIILDQLVIELLLERGYNIAVVARGETVRDDVSVDEALKIFCQNEVLKSHLDSGSLRVITDGSYFLGADLRQSVLHPEFLTAWQQAGIYIAKGGGNFISMLGQKLSLPGLHLRMMKAPNAYEQLGRFMGRAVTPRSTYDMAFIFQPVAGEFCKEATPLAPYDETRALLEVSL